MERYWIFQLKNIDASMQVWIVVIRKWGEAICIDLDTQLNCYFGISLYIYNFMQI